MTSITSSRRFGHAFSPSRAVPYRMLNVITSSGVGPASPRPPDAHAHTSAISSKRPRFNHGPDLQRRGSARLTDAPTTSLSFIVFSRPVSDRFNPPPTRPRTSLCSILSRRIWTVHGAPTSRPRLPSLSTRVVENLPLERGNCVENSVISVNQYCYKSVTRLGTAGSARVPKSGIAMRRVDTCNAFIGSQLRVHTRSLTAGARVLYRSVERQQSSGLLDWGRCPRKGRFSRVARREFGVWRAGCEVTGWQPIRPGPGAAEPSTARRGEKRAGIWPRRKAWVPEPISGDSPSPVAWTPCVGFVRHRGSSHVLPMFRRAASMRGRHLRGG